jgi:hypothetical protein
MRAILVSKGTVDVYILQEKDDAEPEVNTFFDENRANKQNSGYVKGFFRYIQIINTEGYKKLTKEQFSCWSEEDELFCELKRGPFRIGCFKYEDKKRLLLVTAFRKKAKKAKKEYIRSVRLKKRFDTNPVWEKT